ncbi:hypothetical protein Cgig2_007760 [Carnegiea gigantea]|uniref:DUF7788 domain-containing protein n=1 Tax=Carnegiea gigantea TaxID=171969 RepID=A0A9Q1QFT1_9CARY|nr:hypothetical protein Cgig2_007760 [Carnegiea gigantea]
MEFDQASRVYDHSRSYSSFWSHQNKHEHAEECKRRRGWETDYEMIVRKFKKGFQEVPEIVFWNLRCSDATPVTCSRRGVNLMRLFLDKDVPSFTPIEAMELATASEEHQKLLVYDRVVLPIFLQADAEDDSQDSFDDLIETDLAAHAKFDVIMDKKRKHKT